jgi:glutaminase
MEFSERTGVGGGIIAALPGQFGLGTFSPALDDNGNSVRGIKVCELISSHFGLHMLNRPTDVRTSIIADYDIKSITSRRSRHPREHAILDKHCSETRVLELAGALNFANADYVTRRVGTGLPPAFLIIDLRRVPTVTEAAASLVVETMRDNARANGTLVISGVENETKAWKVIGAAAVGIGNIRRFDLLDDAIEWVEDQLIYRYGGYSDAREASDLTEQALLAGLEDRELTELRSISIPRQFRTGERIVAAGEPAASIFFLTTGMVSVKLPNGVRLATLGHGMVCGEMALIEKMRTADVWADTPVSCFELTLNQFESFCERHARSGHRVIRNLADLLAKRLIQANAKVGVLSGY